MIPPSPPMMNRVYKNQLYICFGSEPYHRRNGTKTQLLHWQSACDTCSELFIFKTPASESALKFSPNRRSDKHKRPGVRVRGAV